jgi:hypothetical protein
MKDYGYCSQEDDYRTSEEYYIYHFKDSLPVFDEYLYQFPESFELRETDLITRYEFRSNWQAKPGRPKNITQSQLQQWQEAYDDHHFHAVRTYTDAYNRVWFLPDLTWRQIGRDCWITACALAATRTPSTALVVAFTTLLSQYGLHCLDEWDYIQEKLKWSQHHFDQCAIYANMLQQ